MEGERPIGEPKGRPILIADDDPLISRLLATVLKRLGRPVLVAPDGDAALRIVREARPELLILDVHMPKRTGIEVLRTLRKEDADPGLRVLVLTTLAQADSEARIREAGADDFLAKPVDPEVVLEHAAGLLGGR